MVLKFLYYCRALRKASVQGLLILLVFFCAAGVSVAEQAGPNPHVFGAVGFCYLCHTENPPKLKAGVIEICGSCHEKNISDHPVYRHPMGNKVKILTPSPLPLSRDMRLVCSTCHDPHAGSGFRRLLRVDYQTLCIQCHANY